METDEQPEIPPDLLHVEGEQPIPPSRPPYKKLLKLIVDGNPLYLLSALFMMLGCYKLIHALDPGPYHIGRVMAVLGVLNVYELLLIGLSLLLIRRRAEARDGRLLFSLAILFLSDATLLNTMAVSSDPQHGAWVSILSLALAMIKGGLIVYLFRLRLPAARLAWLGALFALVFALPGILSWRLIHDFGDNGGLKPFDIYAAWWAVGMLIATAGGPRRGAGPQGRQAADSRVALCRILTLAPWLSLALHFRHAYYAFEIPFAACHLAPAFLGAAVLLVRHEACGGKRWRRPALACVGIAAATSLRFPQEILGPAIGDYILSPYRLGLAGSGVVLLYAARHYRSWLQTAAGALMLAIGSTGHTAAATLAALSAFSQDAAQTGTRTARTLARRTPTQWGILWVALGFLTLAAGAVFSFWRELWQKVHAAAARPKRR